MEALSRHGKIIFSKIIVFQTLCFTGALFNFLFTERSSGDPTELNIPGNIITKFSLDGANTLIETTDDRCGRSSFRKTAFFLRFHVNQ